MVVSCLNGSIEYYFIESDSNEAANGCYERTNKKNPQIPAAAASRYPIYKKTGKDELYLMLESGVHAKWIISSDETGENKLYRKL